MSMAMVKMDFSHLNLPQRPVYSYTTRAVYVPFQHQFIAIFYLIPANIHTHATENTRMLRIVTYAQVAMCLGGPFSTITNENYIY